MIERRRRGVLDAPDKPGHDSGGLGRRPRKYVGQSPPFEPSTPPRRPMPGARRFYAGSGGHFMESIRPDTTEPIPLRPAPNQFGTIMLRFVGLLAVAIAVLAFVYSR
ncbi:hypothetical protein BDS110ZK17_33570 [Bradyrhizobium diazoefficiens]